jgi:hypothetical protein
VLITQRPHAIPQHWQSSPATCAAVQVFPGRWTYWIIQGQASDEERWRDGVEAPDDLSVSGLYL